MEQVISDKAAPGAAVGHNVQDQLEQSVVIAYPIGRSSQWLRLQGSLALIRKLVFPGESEGWRLDVGECVLLEGYRGGYSVDGLILIDLVGI